MGEYGRGFAVAPMKFANLPKNLRWQQKKLPDPSEMFQYRQIGRKKQSMKSSIVSHEKHEAVIDVSKSMAEINRHVKLVK